MIIQSMSMTQPLRKLGISIQPSGKTRRPVAEVEASAAPKKESNEFNTHESVAFGGLQLLDFDQAYLLNKTLPRQKHDLNPDLIKESHLLNALSHLGAEIDLDRALNIQSQAASIVQRIRQQTPIAEDTQLLLVIEGAFGTIELDLEKLQPEHLSVAFAAGLAQSPSEQIEVSHQQIAGLNHKIRSQMRFTTSVAEAQRWLNLSQAAGLKLPEFLQAALGYNPLDQEQSVRYFLNETQNAEISKNPETLALERLIAERVAALVAEANALGDLLELAPQPDSPDVLELLRAFMAIFKQLDLDLKALLKPQLEKQNFDRQVLAQFATQLQARLKISSDFLDQLQAQPTDRLGILVTHYRQDLAARLSLIQQSALSTEEQQIIAGSRELLLAA